MRHHACTISTVLLLVNSGPVHLPLRLTSGAMLREGRCVLPVELSWLSGLGPPLKGAVVGAGLMVNHRQVCTSVQARTGGGEGVAGSVALSFECEVGSFESAWPSRRGPWITVVGEISEWQSSRAQNKW
jgi:hypothetical protein